MANQGMSAAYSVDTRQPPALRISASRRIASAPFTHIEYRIYAVGMLALDGIDHVDVQAVVRLIRAEPHCFIRVAMHGRDDVRPPRPRQLNGLATNRPGGSHDDVH